MDTQVKNVQSVGILGLKPRERTKTSWGGGGGGWNIGVAWGDPDGRARREKGIENPAHSSVDSEKGI